MIWKKIIFLYLFSLIWISGYSQKTEAIIFGEYAVILNYDSFDTIAYLNLYSDYTYIYTEVDTTKRIFENTSLLFFQDQKKGSFIIENDLKYIDFNSSKIDRTYIELIKSKMEIMVGKSGRIAIRDGRSRSFPAYTIVKI